MVKEKFNKFFNQFPTIKSPGLINKFVDYFSTNDLYFIGLCFIISLKLFNLTGEPIWDDNIYYFNRINDSLTIDQLLKSLTTDVWSVSSLIYQILPKIFGNNPILYHFLNVVIHTFNCYLLFILIKKIPAVTKNMNYIIVLLFCIHPFQQMAVSWMFQIKTLLAYSFLLGSYYYYQRTEKLNPLSLILFYLSLKTKFIAILFPFAYLIIKPRQYKKLIPFMLISFYVLFQFVNSSFFTFQVSNNSEFDAKVLFIKTEELAQSNKTNIVLNLFKQITFDFIFPIENKVFYNFDIETFTLIFSSFIFLLLVFLNIRNYKIILFLLVNLILFAGIIKAPFLKYNPISDQNLYHLMPILIYLYLKMILSLKDYSLIAVIIFFIFFSYKKSTYFKTEETFYSPATYYSKSTLPYINLAIYYLNKKKYDEYPEVLRRGFFNVKDENLQNQIVHFINKLNRMKKENEKEKLKKYFLNQHGKKK